MSNDSIRNARRHGQFGIKAFTLVELLVVIAVIGILVGLLLPAVQSAREGARRVSCTNNMVQLSLALSSYYMAHDHLPAGTVNDKGPIVNTPGGFHHSWIVQILPMFDQLPLYNNMRHDQTIYSPANAKIRAHSISTLQCASSWNSGAGLYSNYAAVHNSFETPIDVNNDGVFFLNSHLSYDDITDGLSYTLALGEKSIDMTDLGWSSGTSSTLRNLGSPLNVETTNNGVPAYPIGIVIASQDGKFLDNDMDGVPDDVTEPVSGLRISNGSGETGMTSGAMDVLTGPINESYGWTAYPGDPTLWLSINQLPSVIPGRPNSGSDVGGFSSFHGSVMNFAAADGTVRTISKSIDRAILLRMANRKDGQLTKSLDGL